MSVKLIAVDMDGTFLSDEKTYHRERFLEQYARMKAQGIRFVVASGNQYYQLISFFPEIAHEIAFVAENGGWVVNAGEDVFNGELTQAQFNTVARFLCALPGVEVIACGKSSAYTLKAYDDALKIMAAKYYHRLEMVESFENINDIFFKFALNLHGKFASRGNSKAKGGACTAKFVFVAKQGRSQCNAEGDGLTGACLRGNQRVFAI